MGAISSSAFVVCTWAAVLAPVATTSASSSWPNAWHDFETGGRPGLLDIRREAVHRDFRVYYRVVALELLLVHHGDRRCESSRADDQYDLAKTHRAIEKFQKGHSLHVDVSQLDDAFWQAVVVPVRPGETSSAALALSWLAGASLDAARPPLWDAAAVQTHGCQTSFNDDLKGLLAAAATDVCLANATELARHGVSSSCWRKLLAIPEARLPGACEVLSPIGHIFGAVWLIAWIGITTTFAVFHLDGKSSGNANNRSDGTSLGCWQRHRYVCQAMPMLAMMIGHNLAATGTWSINHDLVKQLFVSLLVSGGAAVAVRLATVRGRDQECWWGILLAVLGFTLGNVGVCFIVLALPYSRGWWLGVLLTLIMPFWGFVTALLASQNRVVRGVLLFVMCSFAVAVPAALSIGSAVVNKTGLWIAAFTPSFLLLIIVLNERIVGHLIVLHGEYTAVTQWLLAIIFRLCIEIVRFNTALAVLLLSLVSDSGFWFLLLHLMQTFIFDVLVRVPSLPCWNRTAITPSDSTPLKASSSSENKAPFTAAEIVLCAHCDPWTYRSRAAKGPVEAMLFLAHVGQLIFMGLPSGVNHGLWILGILLIMAEALCHEFVAHILECLGGKPVPRMPWEHVPGHLLALSAGVGTAMSSFAQVNVFWLLYAHHWPACFLDGGGDVDDGSPTVGNAFRIFATVLIALAALGGTTHAFLSWLNWVWTVERQEHKPQVEPIKHGKASGRVRLMVVVPGQDDPDEWDEPDEEPAANSGDMVRKMSKQSLRSMDIMRACSRQSMESRHSKHSRLSGRPSTAAIDSRILDLSASMYPNNGSDQGDVSEVSRTWEQTLTSLWDDRVEDDEQDENLDKEQTNGRSSLGSSDSGVERTRPGDASWAVTGEFPGPPRRTPDAHEDDWIGAKPLPFTDVQQLLSTGLLRDLGVEDKDSSVNEGRTADVSDDCDQLLSDVLAEMPSSDRDNSVSDEDVHRHMAQQAGQHAGLVVHHIEIEEDPLTKQDFDQMAEAEELLRQRSRTRSEVTHTKSDATTFTEMLGKTLTKDDLNSLLDSLDEKESAEMTAAEIQAEKAVIERELAAMLAADREAKAQAEEMARVTAESAAKKAMEEDAARQRAEAAKHALEAAERKAAQEMARKAAQEDLCDSMRKRVRTDLEVQLRNSQEHEVAQKYLDEAQRIIEQLLQEEALAKAAAEAAAAKAAAKAMATDLLVSAIQQRSRPVLEQRLADAIAHDVTPEHVAKAHGVIQELLKEEAAAAAREALISAVQQRCHDMLMQAIADAKEHSLPPEMVRDAERVLNEVIDEENRLRASQALAHACDVEDIEELNLAIEKAIEAGVDQSLVNEAVHKLKFLRRRDAARRQLQDAFDPKSAEPLERQISRLREALQEARAAGVPHLELQAPSERLAAIVVVLRRENALKAMNEALAADDIERIQACLGEARKAGVEEMEVARVERALQDLIDEVELAHEKEKLLRRRIENAMSAKDTAENATTSKEVEYMLGDNSVTKSLRNTIEEARKLRFVRRAEISKAEAVLNEVTADIKRILVEKRLNEQRVAEKKLGLAMEAARGANPTTHLVLEALEQAVAAARVFNANCRDAEVLLASLRADHERETLAAREGLDRAMAIQDVPNIRARLEQCQRLLLEDVVSGAMRQIRSVLSDELVTARDLDRDARAQVLPRLEGLIGILRALGDVQLRQFHNDLQDLKGALRVFCRVRPMNKRETAKGDTLAVNQVDPFSISVENQSGHHQDFTYDAIFGPDTTQGDVFTEVRSLMQSAFDGFNVTVFSYGQTGAGKTWTLYGSGQEPGISPRTCEEIFRMVARDSERFEFNIRASMVELYLTDLRDLLVRSKTREPAKLDFKSVRQPDGSIAVVLNGVHEEPVSSSEDLAQVVMRGLSSRKVKSTNMNAESSRSHLLLMIKIDIVERLTGRERKGKITIVDLAGSERLAKSGVTGEGQREAIEINKSLTALGDVMMAFCSRSKVVPYRNHKLTQLMQDSLGGSAKTLMFVNISPSSSNVDETANALKYASRARCIENDVKRNK